MSDWHGEAAERLNAVGDAVCAAGGVKVKLGGVAIPELVVDGRVKLACHPRPWTGRLHFCVPRYDGPCRAVGTVDQVTEVAGVVLRLVRS